MTSKTTWTLIQEYGLHRAALDDALDALADADLTDEDERQAWHDIAAQATAELEQWFGDDVPGKLSAMDGYARKLNADADWHKAECKRYAERASILANRARRIMDNALALLDTAGGRVDLEGGRTAKVAERKSEAVIIADDAPIETWGVALRRISISADKAAVKKALKAGQTVEGAELQQRVSRKCVVK